MDTDKNEDIGLEYLRHAIMLENPNAQNLLEHYKTPKITLASRSILSTFLPAFHTTTATKASARISGRPQAALEDKAKEDSLGACARR